jgi:hypothetical protein
MTGVEATRCVTDNGLTMDCVQMPWRCSVVGGKGFARWGLVGAEWSLLSALRRPKVGLDGGPDSLAPTTSTGNRVSSCPFSVCTSLLRSASIETSACGLVSHSHHRYMNLIYAHGPSIRSVLHDGSCVMLYAETMKGWMHG